MMIYREIDGEIWVRGYDIANWLDRCSEVAERDYLFQSAQNARFWANNLRKWLLDRIYE